MTDADTQELVKAMVQRLDAHDVAGLMELMSPDVEFIQPASLGATRGREAVAQRIGPLARTALRAGRSLAAVTV